MRKPNGFPPQTFCNPINHAKGISRIEQDLLCILGRFPDGSSVDTDKSSLGHFQVSLEVKGGKQINGPTSCGPGLGLTGELFFEDSSNLGPAPLLLLGLLAVIAEDIASSTLTITDDDFFGMQVVPHDMCEGGVVACGVTWITANSRRPLLECQK
jgi:hypothetical protein